MKDFANSLINNNTKVIRVSSLRSYSSFLFFSNITTKVYFTNMSNEPKFEMENSEILDILLIV